MPPQTDWSPKAGSAPRHGVAQTTVGRDGITAYGLDGARLLEVMSQFQRRTDA